MYLYIYSLDKEKTFKEIFPPEVNTKYLNSKYLTSYIYRIFIDPDSFLEDVVNTQALDKIQILLDNYKVRITSSVCFNAILIGPFNTSEEKIVQELSIDGHTVITKDKYSFYVFKNERVLDLLTHILSVARNHCFDEDKQGYIPDVPYEVSNVWPISELYREFPATAFRMYKEEGITELVSETIPLGHKAIMTFYKDSKTAKKAHSNKKYNIVDEQGKQFFEDKAIEHALYKDIECNLTSDVTVLETMVLPFKLKEDLTTYNKYIDICYLNRNIQEHPLIYNIDSFNSYFNEIKKQNKLSVIILDIVKVGNVEGEIIVWEEYPYSNNLEKHRLIKFYANEFFKPVQYNYVNLEDRDSMDDELFHWSKVCIKNKGILYKPIQNNGQNRMIHSPEYLKLLYGMDYQEKGFF